MMQRNIAAALMPAAAFRGASRCFPTPCFVSLPFGKLTAAPRQRSGRGSDGRAITKKFRKVSGYVVLWHGVTVRERHDPWWMYRCGLRLTVGNKNSASTGRNGPKNGYAKNTVLDDVGIFFILLYELFYLGVLFYDIISKK